MNSYSSYQIQAFEWTNQEISTYWWKKILHQMHLPSKDKYKNK